MEALTDINGHVHHHQSPPIAYKTKILRPIFHLKNIVKMKIKALLSITATAEVIQIKIVLKFKDWIHLRESPSLFRSHSRVSRNAISGTHMGT